MNRTTSKPSRRKTAGSGRRGGRGAPALSLRIRSSTRASLSNLLAETMLSFATSLGPPPASHLAPEAVPAVMTDAANPKRPATAPSATGPVAPHPAPSDASTRTMPDAIARCAVRAKDEGLAGATRGPRRGRSMTATNPRATLVRSVMSTEIVPRARRAERPRVPRRPKPSGVFLSVRTARTPTQRRCAEEATRDGCVSQARQTFPRGRAREAPERADGAQGGREV